MRRFGAVRHIADLFDRYGVHRPDMLRAWAAGRPTRRRADGWQPELWRRLRARIGARVRPSGSRRRASGSATTPGLLDLPPRLSLFGLTRIPRSYLDVLGAIADARDVHLFVLHPSPALWEPGRRGARTARRSRTGARTGPPRRPPTGCSPPGAGTPASSSSCSRAPARRVDHHHELPAPSRTRCSPRIQADIRADRPPPGPAAAGRARRAAVLDPDDRSVQIHACHGRARQVEVLRDAVLHLLEDDPTLEPRDVIVMCPDIETFAPLIQATFGSGRHADDDDERAGRTTSTTAARPARPARRPLAAPDQPGARRRQPAAGARRPARDRVAAARPGRRASRCAGASASTTTTCRECRTGSPTAAIRWGFDAAHREPFKLGALHANTWRRGLDRMLVGVAMTEEDRRLSRACCRSTTSTAARSTSRAASPSSSTASRRRPTRSPSPKPIGGWVDAIARGGRRAHRDERARCLAAARAAAPARRRRRRVRRRERRRERRGARARRRPRAARRPAPRPPDPGELPHRPPDRLHARADALGPAPRRLHPRARRRRVPAPRPPRRRRPDARRARTSATATRAPRTGRCCSTR